MNSLILAAALVVPFAVLAPPSRAFAQVQQEDLDKIHVRIARKVAPATVAVEGGGVRGSGVLIDKSGVILTSPTAVGTATSRVTVLTQGSHAYTGKVLGRANDRELVVVKIDAGQDLPFVELGDSDAAKAGQIAYVFGDSYDSIRSDDQAAMSLGVLSGIYELTQRHDKSLYTGKVLETSAAVNPSQNGGPLVDRDGRLLGLVTLNYDDSKFTGLAVPINALKPAIDKIRRDYSDAPVVLGPPAEPRKPTGDAAPAKPEPGEPWLGLEVRSAGGGVEILRVSRRSPAHRAGLRRGDVLTQIDSVRITTEEAFLKAIARKSPEDTVKLTVNREAGGTVELSVKLAAKPVY
ncbi:MAG TPA: S1C family serine protease [Planctomycetota bacterium]|nr:S1C family serine protease [Planctomycetota bacterium]